MIDDESDYYQSSNIWLSSAEREKLQKQEADRHATKHASRLERNITIDFMGRTVEESQLVNQFDDEELEERDKVMLYDESEFPNVCPTIEFDRPTVRSAFITYYQCIILSSLFLCLFLH